MFSKQMNIAEYALIDPPKINLHLLKRKINYVQPCSAEM